MRAWTRRGDRRSSPRIHRIVHTRTGSGSTRLDVEQVALHRPCQRVAGREEQERGVSLATAARPPRRASPRANRVRAQGRRRPSRWSRREKRAKATALVTGSSRRRAVAELVELIEHLFDTADSGRGVDPRPLCAVIAARVAAGSRRA